MTQQTSPNESSGNTPKYRRLVWSAIILLLMAAASFWLKPRFFSAQQQNATDGKAADAEKTVIPVTAAAAVQQDFPIYLDGLGTVTPLQTVTVRSRVDGELVRVAFKEGQTVRAGEVLAEIDPRPFQAQLLQAEGQLLRDEALLKNAQTDLARYRTLLAQDSIAAQQTVTQEALVKQYEGTVKADRGLVTNAKLQLDYARIVAPISGRAGLRLVDRGNIVHATDTTGLVVIVQMQPIAVVFTLAEDDLPALMRRLQANAKLPLEAYDRAGKTKLAEGLLLAVDNQIDPATGTVKLKGQFANENNALFANQFVNIKMRLDTLRSVTVIPAAALQRGTPGTFVYVVSADQTVTIRPLKIGPSDGEKIAVLESLKAGEQVVVDGIDKLHEGAKVELINKSP